VASSNSTNSTSVSNESVSRESVSRDPLANWPNRQTLSAGDTTVLWWSRGDTDRDGRPWADGAVRPEGVDVADCADVVLRELSGWALSTDDSQLAQALQGRHARLLRSALSLSLPLTEEPALRGVPDRISLGALTPDALVDQAEQIGAVALRAYRGQDGWPDAMAAAASMRKAARGEVLGPLLDSSVLATRGDTVVGACLITDRTGVPPFGGPWVLDIFRDPDDPARGVGAAMLAHAARSLRSVGLAALSLVVTADNEPALALYRSLGFEEHGHSWTLVLP
jgi:ribosomal protein S18 acetylase RimI-like enzyme